MSEQHSVEEQVMTRLSTVIEPELHKDLVTLHMIRDLQVEGDTARFTIVLTTPACPLKDQIGSEARQAVLAIPEISQVEITFTSNVPTSPRVAGQDGLRIKNLIAVSSGKGGVGKSTVASNLAVALAQAGARVGLMDADITGPNLPILMGLEGRHPDSTGSKLIPLEAYGVKIMSMGFLVDPEQAIIWRGPMIHHAIRQLFNDVDWGDLDYMVIDLPPGTGDAQLTLAQSVPVTGALIVTQPQEVALGDALRGLTMFEQVDVPIIGIVENMSGDFFGEGGGQRLATMRGVPFLGSIPLDPEVRAGGDQGRPIVAAQPDSPAAVALTRLAQEVAARVSVMALNQSDNVIPLTTIE